MSGETESQTDIEDEQRRRLKWYGDLYDAILCLWVIATMGIFTFLNIPPWLWTLTVPIFVGFHFLRKYLWGF